MGIGSPDVLFDGGPIMEGTWFNPTTGDRFTVRDSFFEDNNYVVVTTDGRTLTYSQFQNYVKDTTPGAADKPRLRDNANKKASKDELPPEVLAMAEGMDGKKDANDMIQEMYDELLLPEDKDIIYGPAEASSAPDKGLGRIFQEEAPQQAAAPKEDPDFMIIEKALGSKDSVRVDISTIWNEIPSKEITLLNEVMNIPLDRIADWYADRILRQLDLNELRARLTSTMKSALYEAMSSDVLPESSAPKEPEAPKAPKAPKKPASPRKPATPKSPGRKRTESKASK